jgi:DNA (cytosine-5)-methyltransferase 1
MLQAIDIFSGAGGLSLGLVRAGVKVILANEIEPDFAQTHEINHPETRMIRRDIHEVDFRVELKKIRMKGKIDLVCGGPPCQGFSTVGKKEFADPRNSLFGQFLKTVDQVSPRYLLFENVSGFKKMYQGAIFEILLNELAKRGFQTFHSVLNARDFGLPQSRERTIIVGWLSGERPVRPPGPTHGESDLLTQLTPHLNLMDAISDLPPLGAGEEKSEYLKEPQNPYQKEMRKGARRLTEHHASNYGEHMQQILKRVPPGGSVLDLPKALRPKSYFNNTYARLHADRPSPTITRNFGTPSSSRCIHPFQNRALSTREGARLQGFPDVYEFHGSKGSKNLQIGNAVPPIFGEIIARQILKSAGDRTR